MLKPIVGKRSLTFFIPSSRLSDYNKRLLQEAANYENLEYNYNKLESQPLNPVSIVKSVSNDFHFTGSNLAELLSERISSSTNQRVLSKTPNSNSYWKKHVEAIRRLLENPSDELLFERVKALCFVKANETQLDQFTEYERSLIIKRLLNHYINELGNFKREQKNKNKLSQDPNQLESQYKYLTDLAADLRKTFNLFLKSDSYDFTIDKGNQILTTNRQDNIKLTMYDFQNIVQFFVLAQSNKRAIDIISVLESKNYKLTNLLWALKIELLTNSSMKAWKIYGTNIFKGYSGRLPSKYEYKPHVRNVNELLNRYQFALSETQMNEIENDGIYSLNNTNSSVSASFIRSFGENGDVGAIDEYMKSNWGVIIKPDNEVGGISKKFKINLQSSNLPDLNVLLSVILAYAKNGELVKGLQISQALMSGYGSILTQSDLFRYWHLVLKLTGLFGNTVSFHVRQELETHGLASEEDKLNLNMQYLLFDSIWQTAEASVGIANVSKGMIFMRMKYGSLDSLIEGLPIVYQRSIVKHYNRDLRETNYNKNIFRIYLKHIIYELASRERFLQANELLEKYLGDNCLGGKESLNKDDIYERQQIHEQLKYEQDKYAMERVKETRKSLDDDDDFELW